MNARYYDSTLNRFLSADTIVPDPTNPQSFNRYSYVENRPTRMTDPSGHCGGESDLVWDSNQETYVRTYTADYQECNQLRENLENQYEIGIDWFSWTLSDMNELANSIYATDRALSTIGVAWSDTKLKGVTFERVNSDTVGFSPWLGIALYSPLSHKIELGNQGVQERIIWHELGHAISSVSPFMDLHDSYLMEASGSPFGRTPTRYHFRDYGKSQPEGWADAFSSFVFEAKYNHEPLPLNWPVIDPSLNVDFGKVIPAVKTVLQQKYFD